MLPGPLFLAPARLTPAGQALASKSSPGIYSQWFLHDFSGQPVTTRPAPGPTPQCRLGDTYQGCRGILHSFVIDSFGGVHEVRLLP